MWSLEYLRQTGGDIRGWFSGWSAIADIPGKQVRTPIGKAAMAYLRETKARLWY
jgi:hypothetical protein